MRELTREEKEALLLLTNSGIPDMMYATKEKMSVLSNLTFDPPLETEPTADQWCDIFYGLILHNICKMKSALRKDYPDYKTADLISHIVQRLLSDIERVDEANFSMTETSQITRTKEQVN